MCARTQVVLRPVCTHTYACIVCTHTGEQTNAHRNVPLLLFGHNALPKFVNGTFRIEACTQRPRTEKTKTHKGTLYRHLRGDRYADDQLLGRHEERPVAQTEASPALEVRLADEFELFLASETRIDQLLRDSVEERSVARVICGK